MSPGSAPSPRPFHHGDLRAELIRVTAEIIGETGVGHFSVAEAARRAGVSSAAPYKHFADRDALLAAVATRASEQLAERYRDALGTSDDPAEQLAAVSAAYVRFAAASKAGVDVIYAAGLDKRVHAELRESGRALIDLLIPIGQALTTHPEAAIALLEAQTALAHGFATLLRDGFFAARTEDPDDVAGRAAAATRVLVRNWPGGRAPASA